MLDRIVGWCSANPKLFWAIVIVGGAGDAVFLYYYFS
tara:strand:- start:456 stop:566 length:111 start_codon:yes stop_codon:yes gene_type:complete